MILNDIGHRWGHKKSIEDFPVEPEEKIKVMPRETFVKRMLSEHESAVKNYPTMHSYQTVMPTTSMCYPTTAAVQYYDLPQVYPDLEYRFDKTTGKVAEVRSGYRGAVRAQYIGEDSEIQKR